MTRQEARRILDAVKFGEAVDVDQRTIIEALIALGDLPNPLQSVAQSKQEDPRQ